MKIKAVLFDVDGVLYDSMPLHAKSWAEAYKHFGLKLNPQLSYFAEGMPDTKVARFMTPSLNNKEALAIAELKRELFNKYRKPKLIKGAKQLINYLRKNKLKICLVTGSSQSSTIKRARDDFGIQRSHIITGSEVRHGKPNPEPFLKALKKIKATPKHTLVIENAPLGIQSAKRAKLTCVALKTGLISKKDLQKSKPDYIYNDCKEVLNNIHDLLN